jgi:hypothetical protein
VHLNPSRSSLVTDPLVWPFSTHRDACGLAVPGVVPREHDVERFHRYVSSDPRVAVNGTPLPTLRPDAARSPEAVLHAVSAVTRTPLSWITQRRIPERRLYLRAALALCPDSGRRAIGDLVHLDRNAAARAAAGTDPAVDIVARVLGDPRFPALHDREMRWWTG